MATYLEQSLLKLAEFEGAIPWMYRDTVGKMTVAIGRMLPDAPAAQALPFQVAGRAATPVEIAAEFARVEALPMGRPAQFYRRPGVPELTSDQMSSLLRTVLLEMEAHLRVGLRGYDSLPDAVKLALLDMSYNLGVAGLLQGYPRLIQAVEAGNWTQAASVCSRRGPGAARNEWTRQQFLVNVITTVKAEAEGLLKRFGFGVLGMMASWFGR